MRTSLLIAIALAVLTGCRENHQPLPEGQEVDSSSIDQKIVQSNYSPPSQGGVGGGSSTTMGKVVAERYADLSFETALPIAQVLVKNGQQVHRGQVLARLDQFKLRNAITQQQHAIEQAELKIEQARLQMQDVIISQGYDPDKEASIPGSVKHHADIKSGYALSKSQLATAKSQLAAAQHELSNGLLTAPFDGVVANIAVQAHQLAEAGKVVCRVIASGNMAVEFRVMEADLSKYKMGTAVTVVPVADKSARYEATISEINPVVDNQGAITLRARLNGAKGLFDGMNVEVIVIEH